MQTREFEKSKHWFIYPLWSTWNLLCTWVVFNNRQLSRLAVLESAQLRSEIYLLSIFVESSARVRSNIIIWCYCFSSGVCCFFWVSTPHAAQNHAAITIVDECWAMLCDHCLEPLRRTLALLERVLLPGTGRRVITNRISVELGVCV